MSAPKEAGTFSELVYDREAWPFIKERWPMAKFADASDPVHDGRFRVDLPASERDTFYAVMLLEGWTGCCLGFELARRLPDKHDDVMRWIDVAKAIKPTYSDAWRPLATTDDPKAAR